jgi:hypothetical protein
VVLTRKRPEKAAEKSGYCLLLVNYIGRILRGPTVLLIVVNSFTKYPAFSALLLAVSA